MPKRRTQQEVQLLNPLATPDWRYRRVLQILKRNTNDPRPSVTDDDYTRRLLTFSKYWKNRGRGKSEEDHDSATKQLLFHKDPDLYIAYGLRQESVRNPLITISIQARLLAGQSYSEIGAMVGCTPACIEAYERCWFSVVDRLHQSDWIINRVVAPAYQKSQERWDGEGINVFVGVARPFVSAGILLLSYRGGPAVCEYLLGGKIERDKLPTDRLGAEKFIASHAIGSITRRAAIAAEEVILHADNITEMFRVFAHIIDVQNRADRAIAEGDKSGSWGKFLGEMREVIDVSTERWFAPNVDPQHIASTAIAKYDGENDEMRTGDLARMALGEEVDLDVMPPRELKPLLKPDQLRDRMAGAIQLSMEMQTSLEGENGEPKQ